MALAKFASQAKIQVQEKVKDQNRKENTDVGWNRSKSRLTLTHVMKQNWYLKDDTLLKNNFQNQPRPQGFSLKKWVGREKLWERGCSKIPHNISNISRHCPLTKFFSYNTLLTRLYYSIFELPKPLFQSVVANRDSLKQRSLRQLEYDLLCLSATNPENSERVTCQLYRCYLLTENSALKII